MKKARNASLLLIAALVCFAFFSFKGTSSNEDQLSNLENFTRMEFIDQDEMAVPATFIIENLEERLREMREQARQAIQQCEQGHQWGQQQVDRVYRAAGGVQEVSTTRANLLREVKLANL